MAYAKTNFICEKVCNILECFLILRDDCIHKYIIGVIIQNLRVFTNYNNLKNIYNYGISN